jgi:hypothetical protein
MWEDIFEIICMYFIVVIHLQVYPNENGFKKLFLKFNDNWFSSFMTSIPN